MPHTLTLPDPTPNGNEAPSLVTMPHTPPRTDATPNGSTASSPVGEPVLNDVGTIACPNWIAEKLELPVDSVATVEVAISSSEVYVALLEYFARTSVDAGLQPPKEINMNCLKPESPGRLSSLWTVKSNDHDSDKPIIQEHRLGLGYARARVDGEDIFIAHIARGDPIEVARRAQIYRAVLMFAKETETIKKVTDNALKWKHKEEMRKRETKPGKYALYTLTVCCDGDVYWRNHGHKDARPLDSIFLKEGQQEAILKDFKSFRKPSTKTWYLEHGLPYRRSYLFYGPPGVGKTSVIRALAGSLKLTTCFLCLADKKMGNKQLQDALRTIPKPSMIVLEDVDVLFNEQRKQQTEATLTFSGLLNALDGLISVDGVLTVMTTNHIERLDPALIRAGRVDRRFEFCPPDREQIKALFKSYYPDCDEGMPKKFADMVFKREEKAARSIATLQQHFVYTRENTAQESLELLSEFFKEFYPNNFADPRQNLYV